MTADNVVRPDWMKAANRPPLSDTMSDPVLQKEPAIADLIALCKGLDEGLRLACSALAQFDARIRKLEIAENKRLRTLSIIHPGQN